MPEGALISQRIDTLQRLSADLTRVVTSGEVTDIVLRHLVSSLGAYAGGVVELTADGREFVLLGLVGYDDAVRQAYSRYSVDTPVPVRDVALTREAVFLGTRQEWVDRYGRPPVTHPASNEGAWAALPLLVGDHLLGALTVSLRESRAFSAAERQYLQAFADLCAQALERSRLFATERMARGRAEQLYALTAALARALTPADVVEAAVVEGGRAVGSRTGALTLLDDDHEWFTLIPGPGMPEDVARAWQRFPNRGESPAARAVRSLEPSYSPTRASFAATGPRYAEVAERLGIGANAALPLVVRGPSGEPRVLGALAFTFGEPRSFGPEEDSFLRGVADQCAQALDRARLYTAEQTARHRAEVLQRVASTLAGARTMGDVARTGLQAALEGTGAAAGSVSLLSEDGAWFEKLLDLGLPEAGLRAWRRYPTSAPSPAADALASRAPQYLASRAEYLERFPTTEHALEELGIQASAVLPLASGEGHTPVGYLAVHYREAHAFGPEEKTFLRADAQVTAHALERARLFHAEQAARAEAEAARAAAEAANQAKSRFLATMSHELRTPLNAIAGYADLLSLGIHGPITDEQQSALQRIQHSQRHLLALINEVLNYARLEAGAVHYDVGPVGVRGALANVESLMLPQVMAKGLHFMVGTCEPDLLVLADAEKLNQVLLNLLSNAVKFTDRGGSVSLTCRSRDTGSADTDAPQSGGREAGVVLIAVRDTGLGIAPDQLERIFEPFVQVGRSLTSGGEGSGLGLAISRDLARGMGGDLVAESIPGAGSTFTLVLPRADLAPAGLTDSGSGPGL